MKAMVYRRYGRPEDVLERADIPEPKVGPESVLVEVAAAGVNPVDWQTMAGGLDSRFDVVFPVTPGWDLCGTVIEAGPTVTRFKRGDVVFGYARQDVVHHGCYAERISVPERLLASKPSSLDVVQAAAVPIAGLTAWQAVVDLLRVGAGESVLVQGAAGGVGGFATQIARHLGAGVIGTASPGHFANVAARGVVPIDYHGNLAVDVHRLSPDGVDAVLDLYGGDAMRVHAGLLRSSHQQKRMVSLADDGVRDIGGRYLFARPDAAELARIGELFDGGILQPPDIQTLPFTQAAQALARSRSGATTGKIVLTI